MMKTYFSKFILIVIAFATAQIAYGQSEVVNHDYVDTIVYKAPPVVDTTMVGVDVFQLLHTSKGVGNADITIFQTPAVEESMRTHIIANKGRALQGYRIRIFFDNSQNARRNSGGAYSVFLKTFKGIPAYRSYVNPYFKVSVGDFRTKAEAMENLVHIKRVFPAAFIVREKIKFPYVDRTVLDNLPDSLEVFKPETPDL